MLYLHGMPTTQHWTGEMKAKLFPPLTVSAGAYPRRRNSKAAAHLLPAQEGAAWLLLNPYFMDEQVEVGEVKGLQ